MESSNNFDGNLLVSGCDSGFGRMAAIHMAERGWKVFAGCLSEEGCRGLPSHRGIRTFLLDLRSEQSISDAHGMVLLESPEGLQGLVNNAGITGYGPVEWGPTDRYAETIQVNYLGAVAITQALLPLIRKGRGRLVFLTSASTLHSLPYLSPYTASKLALDAYATAARRELSRWGIPVSIIEPGVMRTPMTEKEPILGALTKMRSMQTAEIQNLYGEGFMQKRKERMALMSSRAKPPRKVVDSIRHALCSTRPRARYRLGADAWCFWALRCLPETWLDRIFRWLFPHS
jgi:NAD(P)-dependent dehydrogenase (short-subunit alcohol dehydrogenase family)